MTTKTNSPRLNPNHSIHAKIGPVRTYCAALNALTGKDHVVIALPAGSAAYNMGYRFGTCERAELPVYLAGGAINLTGVERARTLLAKKGG